MTAWFDQASAEAAEARGDWASAIAVVGGFAECYSDDYYRHNAHLWHMDLLVKAGLLRELVDRAETDVHARRRLDRFLNEDGRDGELRERAQGGDKYAQHLLARLLRDRGGARGRYAGDCRHDATDTFAIELARRPPSSG
ncbi:hypothetical protein [Plantactinospora sp. B5E13]|uniref:hypothetical protein n=1 Tax=unclassified Plantactinospora TaxID=2631981 RepID=UPI00325CDE55